MLINFYHDLPTEAVNLKITQQSIFGAKLLWAGEEIGCMLYPELALTLS